MPRDLDQHGFFLDDDDFDDDDFDPFESVPAGVYKAAVYPHVKPPQQMTLGFEPAVIMSGDTVTVRAVKTLGRPGFFKGEVLYIENSDLRIECVLVGGHAQPGILGVPSSYFIGDATLRGRSVSIDALDVITQKLELIVHNYSGNQQVFIACIDGKFS